VESFDLADIAARLESGFHLRFRGYRSAPPRQHTLTATLDWSADLLTDSESALLRRVAVFASGWTLEAARTACTDALLPVDGLARAIERLVTKSLINVESSDGGARYRLLETVRAYALTRLRQSGEAETFHQRHAQYVLGLAEQAPSEAVNSRLAAVLEREHDEIRVALAWAIDRHAIELGLRLAAGAHAMWHVHGHYAEGCAWLERLLALTEARSSPHAARAYWTLSELLIRQAEYARAEVACQEALRRYTDRDDALGIALTMRSLGSIAMWRGDLVRAAALLEDAALRLHQLENDAEFGALFNCAKVALELGNPDRARDLADDFEARGQSWEPTLAAAAAALLRGLVAAGSGDAVTAERLLAHAFELQKPTEYLQFRIMVLILLGHARLDLELVDQAKRDFAAALQEAYDAGERLRITRGLEGFARSVASKQPAAAAQLASVAAALRARLGALAWPRDVRRMDAWLPAARQTLGEEAFANAWSVGQLMGVNEAVALARTTLADGGTEATLTPREMEVALLVARGLSTRQLAEALVISVATVRVHIDHIMGKLGLHSRTQLALWAAARR
jgi:DNA-binding CsgD family transcriptional regulator